MTTHNTHDSHPTTSPYTPPRADQNPPARHGHVRHDTCADLQVAYEEAFKSQPDPSRTVVKVALESGGSDWQSEQGRRRRAWGFNGQVPGPVIEAHVGDVLEIRLTNKLNEPTAIHWHGLRVPAAMDGTDMVQRPVMPGQTFTYRFKVPDAGTFWYQPHVDETV